jgi:hypothetical protein
VARLYSRRAAPPATKRQGITNHREDSNLRQEDTSWTITQPAFPMLITLYKCELLLKNGNSYAEIRVAYYLAGKSTQPKTGDLKTNHFGKHGDVMPYPGPTGLWKLTNNTRICLSELTTAKRG